MRTLKLLAATAMVAAALVLAPAAYAQTTPTVRVMASQPITEGDVAIFTLVISEPVTTGDIDVLYYLEETERVGEFVNSNLVPDGSEGGGIATIPRAGHSTNVVVWTRADGVHEDSEARNGRTNPLTLTIRPGPDYAVGRPSSATIQVGDDEAGWGTLAWESTDVTVTEGDGHVELALTLSKPYSYPLTLPSPAFVESADPRDDFDITDIPGEVVIPPRSRRIPLRVGIVDDNQPEYAESFGVRVIPDGLPVNSGDLVATVRIADNDGEENLKETDGPTVTVTAGRPTAEGLVAIEPVTEGDAAIFTLALSEKVTDDDIEVAFVLEEAERAGEYVNSDLVNDGSEGSATVKINRHEDGAELVIRTNRDGVHEDSEARNGRTNPLTLTILPGPGYEVGTPSSATHYLIDDEADWGTVGWEATEVTVAEEDGFIELTATLSKPYSYPLTLRTSASLGSASTEADYDVDSANTDVTFAARSQRATVRIGIVDGDEPEETESFLVALVLPPDLPVVAGDVTATVTITDGDGTSEEGPGGQDGPGDPDSQDQEEESAVGSCATWCVYWSATTLAEGESVTMAIRDPSGTVIDSDELAVTLHIGRTEGTADTDDIVVKEFASSSQGMEVHPYETANMHHQGGWVYISELFPYERAKVRTMVVEAVDNLDGVDSETLATWVYVNGDLAGAQVLTITSGPQPQQ